MNEHKEVEEAPVVKRGPGRPRKHPLPRRGYGSPKDQYVRSLEAIGLRELAKRWSVSFSTIAGRASAEGWVEAREAYQSRIAALTSGQVTDTGENEEAVVERQLSWLRSAAALTAEALAADTREFTSRDSALKLLLELMEREQRLLGISNGEGKPIEGPEAEEENYKYERLLKEFEKHRAEDRN